MMKRQRKRWNSTKANSLSLRQFVLWGTGTPLREFLWSEDMADASVHVLLNVDFSDIIGIDKYSSVHYGVAADGVVLLYDKQMGRRVRWSLIRSAEALRFNNSGSALFKTHLTSDLLLLTS